MELWQLEVHVSKNETYQSRIQDWECWKEPLGGCNEKMKCPTKWQYPGAPSETCNDLVRHRIPLAYHHTNRRLSLTAALPARLISI